MMPNNDVKIYTVNEITQRISGILEDNFPSIWVEGEVSNYKKPISGHIYLTLKDESAQLKGVIFKNITQSIKFELKDGLKILCFGRIGVYKVQGQYQLYIEKVEPKGYGALQLAFEQLKEKLRKEGLFDRKYKKPIPVLPHKIGIITSATGAAVRDILNIIDKRFPNVHVIINPVRVQGKLAANEIAQAIADFNRSFKDVDVLIVGRGGGSLEDLWAFNEEVVVRAIFSSKIPVISAVGHQIDYTISDFVADERAATPTRAAEIVIAKKEELEEKLLNYSRRLRSGLGHYSQDLDKRLSNLIRSRFLREPQEILLQRRQHLDELTLQLGRNLLNYTKLKSQRLRDYLDGKLKRVLGQVFKIKRQEFESYLGRLEALSPLGVLKRNYSITSLVSTAKVVKSIKDVKKNDKVQTVLSDGKFISLVKEVDNG